MPERQNFPIPSVINPTGRRCIQLSIPDHPDHIRVVAGLLKTLTDWFAWQRDDNQSGRQLADVYKPLFWAIDWSNMSCCPEITDRRINADGTLEVSYDGGETWQPSPGDDPRESAPTLPPLDVEPGEDMRCAMANNIVWNIKQNQLKLAGEAGAWGSITALIAVLGELLIFLGVTAIIPPLSVILLALAAAILVFGQSAFAAAFTESVWDVFRCIIYCALPDNGIVDESHWQEIKEQINAQLGGVAQLYLRESVNALGIVGLTNMGRTPTTEDESCAGCMCGDQDCGFITNMSMNLDRWEVSTDVFNPAVFEKPIGTTIGAGVAFAAGGTQTLAAYTEFVEPCYITTVTLFTLGRGSASTIGVAYKSTPGGAWIDTGVQSFASWSAGVPKTFDINAPVVAIQIQSEAASGQNNFNTVTIADPTP